MNIALFHEVKTGGARRGANEFANALREKGHTVDLYLTEHLSDTHEKKYYSDVFVYPFVSKEWKGGNWKVKLYKDTIELYRLYILHKKIAKAIEEKQYDFAFIHPSQYTQAPFLLRMLTIPKLYYCQEPLRMIYEKEFDQTETLDFFRKRYERITRKMRKEIDKKNISSSDIIFANSTFTQQNISSAYRLESIVCHMGVDTKRFYPANVKKDIDILYVGSEDPIDGYQLFQDSLKRMKRSVRVDYLLRGKKWFSDDTKLREYYSRAKIVICFGEKEPFGLIPLEVMACGCVPVALDEGGYRDSVKDGKTGIRVKKSPQEIASKLDSILGNADLLKTLAKNGEKNIQKNWQWNKSADSILSNYSIWQKNR